METSEENLSLSDEEEEEESALPDCYDTADEIEFEELDSASAVSVEKTGSGDEDAYASEPLADEEWLKEYFQERKIIEENERKLQNRLDKVVEIGTWCKCGNCQVNLLKKCRECQCCHEIEKCKDSLGSKIVLREVGTRPNCVTNHPGFSTLCLNRWSLRSAAAKYKAQDGTKYKQTGTENKLFRATAYREFTQLIHGFLGGQRIPLPACAYHAIRKQFSIEGEKFAGYENNN